jgi:hypothetical protein
VRKVAHLGWVYRIQVGLDDLQDVVAEIPYDRMNGLEEGDRVYVDLEQAKVFRPDGPATYDELTSV